MKISFSIDIDRRPEDVFPWINNPEKAMIWMTSVSKTEVTHKTADMVGTTFRETVEENGRGTELTGVITNYRPNELIAFHLDGQYNVVDVEYRLVKVGNRTRLAQKAEIRFKSFLKVMGFIYRPVFRKKTMDQLKREFATLKELCERGIRP
jgi:uncharacterized protein YndB with AHSA1/START domain